ncbi:Nitronate monooxygenase-domain-containing protein, partial [Lineolata rhizophorae]
TRPRQAASASSPPATTSPRFRPTSPTHAPSWTRLPRRPRDCPPALRRSPSASASSCGVPRCPPPSKPPSLPRRSPPRPGSSRRRPRPQLAAWAAAIRAATRGATRIWVQVGTVREARVARAAAAPDVLVAQGQDAGGHGRYDAAGLAPLVPEVADALAGRSSSSRETQAQAQAPPPPVLLAAGGIADGRGLAAALCLGAAGAALGTRFLAAREAAVAPGYRATVLAAADGGRVTRRSGVYDALRGVVGWPAAYGGRGVANRSYVDEVVGGVGREENRRRYEEAVGRADDDGEGGWGPGVPFGGRLTAYVGNGVGLVREVMGAGEVTREVREEGVRVLRGVAGGKL